MKPLNPGDPAQIGAYRLLASLGEGGMGRVVLGVAPDGRLVALKQVHPGFAHDEGFRSRFRREVEASRMVSGAYTAAVMDADPDARTPWLASVFVVGPSLREAVDASGPLPPHALRYLAAGLASALTEIHRVGLVHRDLKPSNVLLTDDGSRVIDFGIARAADGGSELTGTGSVIGSPAFMSPEQAEGRPLTLASDVFSLGALLVMAATGRSPFAGTSTAHTLYNVVHAQADLRGVPPEIRLLVEPCLAKEPAGRPTPAQILDHLGPVVPSAQPWPPAVHQLIARQRGDVHTALTRPSSPLGSRRPLRIALAALAAVTLVGGTAITVSLLDRGGGAGAVAQSTPPATSAPQTTTSTVSTDPLGPAKLRNVDPCKVLSVEPVTDVHFFQCTYETAAGGWLDLTIGDSVPPSGSDSAPEEIEGLPLIVDDSGNPGFCEVMVPVTDQPTAGIAVGTSPGRGDVRDKDSCTTAKTALAEVIRRIRSGGVDRQGAPGTLAVVDPCGLLDRAGAERIFGVVTAIEPDGLHGCDWKVTGTVKLSLERAVRPGISGEEPVDLDGVPAYQQKRPAPGSPSCQLSWAHLPVDDISSEVVDIQYLATASQLPVDEVCRRARDFAKAIIPTLPKP